MFIFTILSSSKFGDDEDGKTNNRTIKLLFNSILLPHVREQFKCCTEIQNAVEN